MGRFLSDTSTEPPAWKFQRHERLAAHRLMNERFILESTGGPVNPTQAGWFRAMQTLLMSGYVVPRASRYCFRDIHRSSDVRNIGHSIASLSILFLAGCAGGTSNPVFNSSAEQAYIYSPSENTRRVGQPPAMVGATGEVRYCSAGMPALAQARKKNALSAIAQACGGEDNYAITGELMTDATGSFMGVAVKCEGNAGRAIVFKCKGVQPKPTGFTK